MSDSEDEVDWECVDSGVQWRPQDTPAPPPVAVFNRFSALSKDEAPDAGVSSTDAGTTDCEENGVGDGSAVADLGAMGKNTLPPSPPLSSASLKSPEISKNLNKRGKKGRED